MASAANGAAGHPTPPSPELGPPALGTGKVVSLSFLRSALRRSRRVWLALSAIGLVIGTGYHLVVPVKYIATTTLYLVHPAGSSSTGAPQNDLAMLDTAAVGRRALAMLGDAGKGLTPAKLLGKTPGTVAGTNVLVLTIAGPSPAQAKQRATAVAKAYLAFRAQIYQAQNLVLVQASTLQIRKLDAQLAALNQKIALVKPTQPSQLARLEDQRAAVTTEISGFGQSIQQGEVSTLAVVNGSRVITPATVVGSSKKKVLAVDGLSGLGAGLALGIIAVVVEAALTDRLRRREDVAALLGVPVEVSLPPTPRRTRYLAAGRGPGGRHTAARACRAFESLVGAPGLHVAVHYLHEKLRSKGPMSTQLVVAADDAVVPAAMLVALARRLHAGGADVVVVDDVDRHSLARMLGVEGRGRHTIEGHGADSSSFDLLVPGRPWEAGQGHEWDDIAELASTDVVLVLATVDPKVGAWHLRRWAAEAVVTVTCGRSTAHRLGATAELLDAAGVHLTSAMLVNADPRDYTAGLPVGSAPPARRRLGSLQPAGTAAT